MYERVFKRVLDVLVSLAALIVLSPLLLVLIIVGAFAMRGNPFFFQPRPGRIDPDTGRETIFHMIKFRTMSDRRGVDGKLLPDAKRLSGYGRFLRSTSLDELPELINILRGDMSLVGPRPQLVKDMVFMSPEQRRRHTVQQGLTGLAQVKGRNGITWEKKLEYDLQYVENISFLGDVCILLQTIGYVFKREGITEEGEATALDFGDYLLKKGVITSEEYADKQEQANRLLGV